MADNSALLANIFKMVTKTLVENKTTLNQADEQNHDHGTNMVSTFQTITKALAAQKNAPPSVSLARAAQAVSKETKSGSAQLYAQGLAKAAAQVQGQSTIDPQMAVQLLQTLISGGQTQPQPPVQNTGGDLLGSLLGSLTGAQQQQQQTAQSDGGDLLGSLLGGLAGAQQPQQQAADNGLDIGDLLNAGMAYMNAKQGGSTDGNALLQAVLAGSGMGNTNHRAQSTQLVVNSFMQALGALTNKGK
jgi:hypothetical protein